MEMAYVACVPAFWSCENLVILLILFATQKKLQNITKELKLNWSGDLKESRKRLGD